HTDRLRDLSADRAGDRHVVDVPRSVVVRHLPALLWILRVAVCLGDQGRDGEAAPEGGPRLSIRREHPVPLLEGHRAAHLGRFLSRRTISKKNSPARYDDRTSGPAAS